MSVPFIFPRPLQQPLPPAPALMQDQNCDTITLIFLVSISALVMLFNAFAGVALGALVLGGWALSGSNCLSSSSSYPVQSVYSHHAPYLPVYSPPSYYPSAGIRAHSASFSTPTPVVVRTASLPPPVYPSGFSSYNSYSSSYAQPIPGGRGAAALTTSFSPPPPPFSSSASFQPIPGGRGAAAVTSGISLPPPPYSAASAPHAVPRR